MKYCESTKNKQNICLEMVSLVMFLHGSSSFWRPVAIFASNTNPETARSVTVARVALSRVHRMSYSICAGDADGEKHPRAPWKLTGGSSGKYGTKRARCSWKMRKERLKYPQKGDILCWIRYGIRSFCDEFNRNAYFNNYAEIFMPAAHPVVSVVSCTENDVNPSRKK